MGFAGHLHDRLFFPENSRFLFFAPKLPALLQLIISPHHLLIDLLS